MAFLLGHKGDIDSGLSVSYVYNLWELREPSLDIFVRLSFLIKKGALIKKPQNLSQVRQSFNRITYLGIPDCKLWQLSKVLQEVDVHA